MKNPTVSVLRRFRVTVRLKNHNPAVHYTVAAHNEKQAKRLVRALAKVASIEQVKRYGYVLAPFAA